MALHELNEEQRTFAEEHHNLIYSFLYYYRMDEREYYDIAAIGYLRAAQNYCERVELQQYSFSTIAFRSMFCEIGNSRRKVKRTVSMDTALYDEDGMTLHNSLADPRNSIEILLDIMEIEDYLGKCLTHERDCLSLFAAGYEMTEIAEMLNLSRGQTRGRLDRGRKKMKANRHSLRESSYV